jgi:hypothetical protein
MKYTETELAAFFFRSLGLNKYTELLVEFCVLVDFHRCHLLLLKNPAA